MRILFVYPNFLGYESVHLGLMYLSAYLKKNGHATRLIDFTFERSLRLQLSIAREFEPNLVAFTANSGMIGPASRFANLIKQETAVPIIVGGVHPTVAPDMIKRFPQFDMLCLSEGEQALLELVGRMEAGKPVENISNIWLRKGDVVLENAVRPLIQHLDALPFPDLDLFDIDRYLEVRGGNLDLISGRGCPFRCPYCVNHTLQKLHGQYGKSFARKNSVHYVLQMVRHIKDKFPVKSINFQDDLFTLNKPWIIEFCTRFQENFPDLRFNCNVRPGTADNEVFQYLKKAGCASVSIGIEAGDENIRDKILGRKMSDEMIVDTFQAARSAGLRTASFNMLGLPLETPEQMEKTVAINQKVQPDALGVTIFTPYPGTELYESCLKQGLISPDYDPPPQYRSRVVLNVPSSLKKLIERKKAMFRYRVFKAQNLKKALYFLILDTTYDWFILLRSRIPFRLRQTLLRISARLSRLS